MHLWTAIEFAAARRADLHQLGAAGRSGCGLVWHLLVAALVVVSAILLVAHLAGTPSRITTVWPLDLSPLAASSACPRSPPARW